MYFSARSRSLGVSIFLSAAAILSASPAMAGTYVDIDNGYGLPGASYQSLYNPAGGDVALGDSGSRNVGYCVGVAGCADCVWKPVTGDVWGSASLANAELKARASLTFGENQSGSAVAQLGDGFENAIVTASIMDTFHIAAAGGSPFLWNEDSSVGFNFDVSGVADWSNNLAANPAGFTKVYSELSFLAYDPVTFEVIAGKGWLLGDYVVNSSYWDTLNDPILTPTAFEGVEAVDLLSNNSISYAFNPGGDFMWELRLTNWIAFDVTEEDVFASVDFSHTVKTSYQGPEGSVTWSDSGLFPGTAPVSAVPEPATWAMMITGFALVGGTLRRRHRGLAAV